MECVPINGPAEVARDARVAGSKIKSLEGLAAKEQEHSEQDEQRRSAERNAGRRALAQGKRAQPKSAAGYEQQNAGAREIERGAAARVQAVGVFDVCALS